MSSIANRARSVPFLTEPADAARMPVVLLSGFLGSGKTTLVNALLRDPRLAGTAVAVNEFGAIPLDQHLIEHGADRTVVMANGCLCCNLAGDMEEAVLRLFSRRAEGAVPAFERLIIEPSGLSDPAPIAQAILRNPILSRVLRLDAIVTTVDALFGPRQLAAHPETRKQVALADRVVLTKGDMAGAAPDQMQAAVRGLNPLAPVHAAVAGAIDAAVLLPPEFLGGPAATRRPHRSGLAAELVQADAGFAHGETASVSLVAEAPLRWAAFDTWFRTLRLRHGERLLRAKGLLDIAGTPGPVVINGVHHVMHTPVTLDRWPGDDRRSRLVLITQGVALELLRQTWSDALPGLIQ